MNVRDVGLVYICKPNNPTDRIVPKQDIKLLLNSIPEDIPVFIDEAYHHFVDDPNYEPSIKYVMEGRKVIVARTFSKIAGLAGMPCQSPRLFSEPAPGDGAYQSRQHSRSR